jgi:hypothetical protein
LTPLGRGSNVLIKKILYKESIFLVRCESQQLSFAALTCSTKSFFTQQLITMAVNVQSTKDMNAKTQGSTSQTDINEQSSVASTKHPQQKDGFSELSEVKAPKETSTEEKLNEVTTLFVEAEVPEDVANNSSTSLDKIKKKQPPQSPSDPKDQQKTKAATTPEQGKKRKLKKLSETKKDEDKAGGSKKKTSAQITTDKKGNNSQSSKRKKVSSQETESENEKKGKKIDSKDNSSEENGNKEEETEEHKKENNTKKKNEKMKKGKEAKKEDVKKKEKEKEQNDKKGKKKEAKEKTEKKKADEGEDEKTENKKRDEEEDEEKTEKKKGDEEEQDENKKNGKKKEDEEENEKKEKKKSAKKDKNDKKGKKKEVNQVQQKDKKGNKKEVKNEDEKENKKEEKDEKENEKNGKKKEKKSQEKTKGKRKKPQTSDDEDEDEKEKTKPKKKRAPAKDKEKLEKKEKKEKEREEKKAQKEREKKKKKEEKEKGKKEKKEKKKQEQKNKKNKRKNSKEEEEEDEEEEEEKQKETKKDEDDEEDEEQKKKNKAKKNRKMKQVIKTNTTLRGKICDTRKKLLEEKYTVTILGDEKEHGTFDMFNKFIDCSFTRHFVAGRGSALGNVLTSTVDINIPLIRSEEKGCLIFDSLCQRMGYKNPKDIQNLMKEYVKHVTSKHCPSSNTDGKSSLNEYYYQLHPAEVSDSQGKTKDCHILFAQGVVSFLVFMAERSLTHSRGGGKESLHSDLLYPDTLKKIVLCTGSSLQEVYCDNYEGLKHVDIVSFLERHEMVVKKADYDAVTAFFGVTKLSVSLTSTFFDAIPVQFEAETKYKIYYQISRSISTEMEKKNVKAQEVEIEIDADINEPLCFAVIIRRTDDDEQISNWKIKCINSLFTPGGHTNTNKKVTVEELEVNTEKIKNHVGEENGDE